VKEEEEEKGEEEKEEEEQQQNGTSRTNEMHVSSIVSWHPSRLQLTKWLLT